MASQPVVLLDLDGTLVDSVYLHVVTWMLAFREAGHDVAAVRVHAGVGMGSDRLLPWLLGGYVDDEEELRADHERRFVELAHTLRPTAGALELLDDLERREVPFAIATSAGTAEREALLAALGRDDVLTTDSDAVDESKPYADLLEAALLDLGARPEDATLVGDSPWDAEAAGRLGVRPIGVRCGGFSDEVLLRAGAYDVVDAPRDLIGRL